MNGVPLREMHLFAGAGGGILGGMLLGHVCVCAVELEKYPRNVLLQRQRDGILPWFPIWDDIKTFDGTSWRGKIDVICGGFPCQDISCAGKGAGITGERSGLWGEMARVVREVRPAYVFVENSPMLTSRGLGRVLGDLAALGYNARWGVLGAHHVGAPHKRDRIWIFSWNTNGNHENKIGKVQKKIIKSGGICSNDSNVKRMERTRRTWCEWIQTGEQSSIRSESGNVCEVFSNSDNIGLSVRKSDIRSEKLLGDRPATIYSSEKISNADGTQCERVQCSVRSEQKRANISKFGWWSTEPNVGRVANGLAYRVDRLKSIGNGQVPAVAALAWRILSGDKQ